MPDPRPVTETPAKAPAAAQLADSHAETLGRRTLSTAFVRVGPDGHLTVELRDGRVVVLRDVVMGPKDFCGVQVTDGSARSKYCGGYAEVAMARPGGGVTDQPGFIDPKTIEPASAPAKPD